jgi:hypothetical protein
VRVTRPYVPVTRLRVSVARTRVPVTLSDVRELYVWGLIETGYLRKIPPDPHTRSAATWVPVYAQDPAIVDVRAGKADWLDRLRTLF